MSIEGTSAGAGTRRVAGSNSTRRVAGSNSTRRVACVHEWLTEWGGSEDCFRLMLAAYPQAKACATIDYLSAADRERLGRGHDISTTLLQKAPGVAKRFWNYLPVTGLAVEGHDVGAAEMIISSSHAFAKGVITRADQFHACYTYSPMRYAWDLHDVYLRDYGLDHGIKGLMARYMFHRLRRWDRSSANNVDMFMAISRHVRDRIWRCYRRPSLVIYPPVRTHLYTVQPDKEDHYVTVSRLVSYKRIDIIVEAFRAMPSRKLIVIGDGPEMAKLRATCPANVTLMGRQSDEVVHQHLRAAKAFIFAAHEDFGISPVEAQACGTPVIAFGAGGSLETVRGLGVSDKPTGMFFTEQTSASIAKAVEAFEAAGRVFDPHACREWAEGFSEERFTREFVETVERGWDQWRRDPRSVDQLADQAWQR